MTERLSEFRPRITIRDLIEQAAARGEVPDEIARTVGVSLERVDCALNRMDLIRLEVDRVIPPPKPPRGPRRPMQPCGTHAAYQRHRRRREQPCEPCMDAKRAYTAAYPQIRKRAS